MYTTPQIQKLTQDSNCRTEVVRMRVTPWEKEVLLKRATAAKEKTLSNYLRRCTLDQPQQIVPEINEQAMQQLQQINRSVSHFAHLAQFLLRAMEVRQLPSPHLEQPCLEILQGLQEVRADIIEYQRELKGGRGKYDQIAQPDK